VAIDRIEAGDVAEIANPDGINLAKLAIQYADGIIAGVPEIDPRLADYAKSLRLPILPYVPITKEGGPYVQHYNQFYDDLLKRRR
jgi:starch synthase